MSPSALTHPAAAPAGQSTAPNRRSFRRLVHLVALLGACGLTGCSWGPSVNSSLGAHGVIEYARLAGTAAGPAGGAAEPASASELLIVSPDGVGTLRWQGRSVVAQSTRPLPAEEWSRIVAAAPLTELAALPSASCGGTGADTGSGQRLVVREGFRVLLEIRLPDCDPHAPVLAALVRAWLAPADQGAIPGPV